MIATITAMTLMGMAQAQPFPPSPPPSPPSPSDYRRAPSPGPSLQAHARERFDLASLISDRDYPAAARRANKQGTVGFTLDIGPNGRVTGCTINSSSGSAELDAATCRLMLARARFTPARDSAGMPIAEKYRGRYSWRIARPVTARRPDGRRDAAPPILVTRPPPVLMMAPPPPAPPPPPPPGSIRQPARARANLGSLISVEDYPAAALRNREEGMVAFRLDVAPHGRVSNCIIIQSSNSPSLDSATCRLLTARARFIPAQDATGALVPDTVRGRIVWRIVNDFDRPWAPARFVEEMRSTATGAVTCRQGWPPEELTDEACPAGEAAQLAARARAAGTALERSIVTKLTPEGMTDAPDRPGRGDPYWAADAIFTIGADGKLLECRLVRNEYLGRDRRRGVPPNPCADWDIGTNLYLPAPEAEKQRTVRVKVRGYVGIAARPPT